MSAPDLIANSPTGKLGKLCKPYISFISQFFIRLSSTIALAPPPPSSAGWNTKTTLPLKLRVSQRYFATPKRIVVWPSCPHACILFSIFDLWEKLFTSDTGKASISARNPILRPESTFWPCISATIPLFPTSFFIELTPNSFSNSITFLVVRGKSNCNSGCS